MANNFRIAGDYYFSKAGHDSNDGLTTDSPKKSLVPVTNSINAIGAGGYTPGVLGTLSNITLLADGKVVINDSTIYIKKSEGIFYENCVIRDRWDSGTTEQRTCRNNIYSNCTFNYSFQSVVFSKEIFIGTDTVDLSRNYFSSILINSGSKFVANYKDIYLNFASYVIATGINPTGFRNNNIQGTIAIDNISYAIQDQLTGTPQDNGYAVGVEWLTEANLTANGYTGTIVGWDAAVATCINRDPKFNDASKLDFTLKADSPHLGRASNGVGNIGGTEYAQSFYAGISNPNSLLIDADVDIDTATNPNDWVLLDTSVEGQIRLIAKVSNTSEELGVIDYIGNLSFDSDEIGGTSANFNVPDSKPSTNEYPTYTTTTSDASDTTSVVISGHSFIAGQWLRVEGQDREITSVDTNTLYFTTALRAIVLSGTDIQIGTESSLASLNPNRLNFKARTSNNEINSGNWDMAAIWDNNSLATAGVYLAQEWFRQPMIDNLNGVGFGDDNYDPAFGNPIQAKYIDIIVYLRDNYKS